jgi:predicted Rossmann fold flavoprotein
LKNDITLYKLVKEKQKMTLLVVGAGAAGFFGAIRWAEQNPSAKVILLEKTKQVLAKVRISGGGRCNITHACFDIEELVKNYPRGDRELKGPFSRFGPKETIAWFEERGVVLKTEQDGRMFPITDNSETIVNCLIKEAERLQVNLQFNKKVESVEIINGGFKVFIQQDGSIFCQALLLTTGNGTNGYALASSLGHTIISPVPSLFTFNIPDSSLKALAGVSVSNVKISLPEFQLKQQGPILITHWGFSGPAVLKLSAWGARELHKINYETYIKINWLPQLNFDDLFKQIMDWKTSYSKKQLSTESPFDLPRNLWKALTHLPNISSEHKWGQLSKKQAVEIVHKLQDDIYQIRGKTTYKQEFVTCGGISLSEINFRTMESLFCPRLYFAGEILDIDGVTGGFNFQAAWTTSWLAGMNNIYT